MKEQIKVPEKIQLSDKETANLSDAQFKTLVIRCSQKWLGWLQNRGRSKAMQSEIKKNVQGTNSEGKESGMQINNLELKEEINI